jgi:hypothetical protein
MMNSGVAANGFGGGGIASGPFALGPTARNNFASIGFSRGVEVSSNALSYNNSNNNNNNNSNNSNNNNNNNNNNNDASLNGGEVCLPLESRHPPIKDVRDVLGKSPIVPQVLPEISRNVEVTVPQSLIRTYAMRW